MSQFYAGQQFAAGPGITTVLPDFDFETYSEAGYRWQESDQTWRDPFDAPKRGLSLVGTATYAEHPSTEPLMLTWDLKDGRGPQQWKKGDPPPLELFGYIAAGGVLEAWNVAFEYEIWNRCCVPKLGWPPLPLVNLRCAMAKARAFSLPGGLEKAGHALNLPPQLLKSAEGAPLIKVFSMPRNPTKKDPRLRIEIADDPRGADFLKYNAQDIVAEEAVSLRCPDLSPIELALWQLDQRINARGVAVDADGIEAAMIVVRHLRNKYNAELCSITNGTLQSVSEIKKFVGWLGAWGVSTASVDEENVTLLLKRPDLQPHVRRALEIRQLIASSSVSKLFAMAHQKTGANRLHHLLSYCAAHTGRWTGNGPQPQNLPSAGPDMNRCTCGIYTCAALVWCPFCGQPAPTTSEEWSADAAEYALSAIKTRDLGLLDHLFGGQLMDVVVGCLRSMFIAAPDHELIASDFSAIEAVVLAAMAGEEWRLEVFRTHGKIYEESAAKITGKDLAYFMRHYGYTDEQLAQPEWWKLKPANAGKHHPDRKKIGKIAELASGYRGWLDAWLNFGAGDYFDDKEIKGHILAWRDASPAIVEFWGGQFRGLPWDKDRRPELYGVEGAAVSAVLNPGVAYGYRQVSFQMQGDALYCQLPSGRLITYHEPRLTPQTDAQGRDTGMQLSYMGWDSLARAWIRKYTHGGKLTENIVQAVARDILAHAMLQVDAAGYNIVLHVHDEIVAEVRRLFGSVEEFERIALKDLPAWCANWPLRIAGGWRGPRFRK